MVKEKSDPPSGEIQESCNSRSQSRHKKLPGAVSLLLLLTLLTIAFAPIFTGQNFLPFERYANWGQSTAQASGTVLKPDKAFWSRKHVAPWIADMDFVSLSIFWPQDAFFASSIKKGKFPLWDPYTGSGKPTVDNGQFRPFDPVRWIFYLFPSSWSYCFSLFLELLIGGIGAFWWFRTDGYDSAGALLGSALLVINPWVLDRSGICINDVATWAYFPLVMIGLRQIKPGNRRSLALAALPLILMGQAGNPEPCLLAAGLAGLYYMLDGTYSTGQEKPPLKDRLIGLFTVALLTLAALSILWVPLVVMSLNSFSYKQTGMTFLFEYSWKAPLALASDLFIAPALLPLILASFFSKRKGIKLFLGAAVFSLLVLMPMGHIGTVIKGVGQKLFFAIPLFYFKGILWTALAFLAPAGLKCVYESNHLKKWCLFLAGCVWSVLVIVLAIHLPIPLSEQTSHPVIAFILLGAGLVSLALLFVSGKRKQLIQSLMICLLLVSLAFPLALDHLCWNSLNPEAAGSVRWVKKEHPHDRVVSIGWRPSFVLPPNQGQAFGVRAVEDNGAYFPNNYFRLFFTPPAPPTCIMFNDINWLKFSEMGASFVLVPEESPISGKKATWTGKNALIYGIPLAMGRVYWAKAVELRNNKIKLAPEIITLGRGRDGVAVVETMGLPVPDRWPGTDANEGSIRYRKDNINDVSLNTEKKHSGFLVLRDSWYPGWCASIDGSSVPVYRVNGCFRGLIVPKGKHSIRFRYRPMHVYIPATISLVITVLLILTAFIKKIS